GPDQLGRDLDRTGLVGCGADPEGTAHLELAHPEPEGDRDDREPCHDERHADPGEQARRPFLVGRVDGLVLHRAGERVGERPRIREPPFGIGIERSGQGAVERSREVGAHGPGAGTTPRGFAREEFEEQRGHGVDVRARIRSGPGGLLGGKMLVAEQHRRLARPARRDRGTDPEVDEAHPVVITDDHVVEVEREVEHAAVVRLGERAEGGDPDPNGLGRRRRARRVQPVAETRAGRILADEVDHAVLLAGVEQGGDPPLRQPRYAPSLSGERLGEARILREPGVDQLHGHRASQQRVLRPPHHPGPAPAELLLERVATGEDVSGLDRSGHRPNLYPVARLPTLRGAFAQSRGTELEPLTVTRSRSSRKGILSTTSVSARTTSTTITSRRPTPIRLRRTGSSASAIVSRAASFACSSSPPCRRASAADIEASLARSAARDRISRIELASIAPTTMTAATSSHTTSSLPTSPRSSANRPSGYASPSAGPGVIATER